MVSVRKKRTTDAQLSASVRPLDTRHNTEPLSNRWCTTPEIVMSQWISDLKGLQTPIWTPKDVSVVFSSTFGLFHWHKNYNCSGDPVGVSDVIAVWIKVPKRRPKLSWHVEHLQLFPFVGYIRLSYRYLYERRGLLSFSSSSSSFFLFQY